MLTRRDILAASALLPVAASAATLGGFDLLPASSLAVAQPPGGKPPRLKAGDTVGLVEPSWSSGDGFEIALAEETIRAMGLVPKLGRHVGTRYGFLAGRDEARAADLNAMYADPAVRAIFAVRGGSGAARVLPLLDWTAVRANPKLLIGFSDIEALHMGIAARAGTPTIHGPNVLNGNWGKLSWDAFRALAFEGATPTFATPPGVDDRLVQRSGRIRTFRPGKASGRLYGGNLLVLAALMGTPYLPDFSGAILFLEEVDETPSRIDRMLTHLALGGVLRRLSGVVFGQCTNCTESEANFGRFTVSDVLEQHLTPLGIPAFEGALFGHIPDQFSLPVGVRAEIDATAGTIQILEPVVT
jgi:muramoyltetrapeptide carboxypeptidase